MSSDASSALSDTEILKRLVYFTDHVPWFGSYSGYELLPKTLKQMYGVEPSTILYQVSLWNRIIGKTLRILQGLGPGNTSESLAIFKLHRLLQGDSKRFAHVLYGEHCFFGLCENLDWTNRLITTLHLPIETWKPQHLRCLKVFSAAVVLYQRDRLAFEEYLGKGRVHFVHYGVATSFFEPKETTVDPRRIVVVGVNGRNFEMLERVVRRLLALHPDLLFDFVVPKTPVSSAKLAWTEKVTQVRVLQNISDQELLEIYQRSYLLLLPLKFSGANTSLVEALACGLPPVTTDVGGVRDYGGGSLFDVVSNDDDDAMISLVERYLDNPEYRRSVSNACRQFAVTHLDLEVVAPKYLAIYHQTFHDL